MVISLGWLSPATSRGPGVTWQSALGSSDFPRHATPAGMPRPSHPTATRQEKYRFWKGQGKSRPLPLAHEPSQQAAQAVLRQAPSAGGPGGILGREPESVTFAEHQSLALSDGATRATACTRL